MISSLRQITHHGQFSQIRKEGFCFRTIPYHLPIYRQQDYFAGSGWTPGRSTLLNILTGGFFVIEPFWTISKTRSKETP